MLRLLRDHAYLFTFMNGICICVWLFHYFVRDRFPVWILPVLLLITNVVGTGVALIATRLFPDRMRVVRGRQSYLIVGILLGLFFGVQAAIWFKNIDYLTWGSGAALGGAVYFSVLQERRRAASETDTTHPPPEPEN